MIFITVERQVRVPSRLCTRQRLERRNVRRQAKVREKCHRHLSTRRVLPQSKNQENSLSQFKSWMLWQCNQQVTGSLDSMKAQMLQRKVYSAAHHVSNLGGSCQFHDFYLSVFSWWDSNRLSLRQSVTLHGSIRAIPIPKECLLQLQTEFQRYIQENANQQPQKRVQSGEGSQDNQSSQDGPLDNEQGVVQGREGIETQTEGRWIGVDP